MPHPIFNSTDTAAEKADKIKKFLVYLSEKTEEEELRSSIRQTADFFRERYFGFSERQIKSKIIKVLEDYFDGESYIGIELENLAEETGLKEKTLAPVLQMMIKTGIILEGRRRRHNEMGEHYNALYRLRKR